VETFLVEHYQPGVDAEGLRRAERMLRDAVATLSAEGCEVRYLGSTIVPGDEAFLSLLEASSEGEIRAAHARAGMPFERISQAIDADSRLQHWREER
jgi:Protein of unknown function (DUF4242)